MKRNLFIVIALVALIAAGVWFANHRSNATSTVGTEQKTLYTCGMHPQVVQDHPGDCPICGMKLTPIKATASQSHANTPMAPTSVIDVDSATVQTMGIRTDTVKRGPLRRIIRTVGVIDLNERTMANVATKFKGWVEKLDVNSTGELVMKGDTLFEIYSPELYSAQVEYLLATDPANKPSGNDPLKTSAVTKLKYYDISPDQIADLEKTRQASKTLRVVAPQDGFVMSKNIVEGQMVDMGMVTYQLADLGLVWVQAQIYEQDLVYIKLGQEATVTLPYLPDREFRGRVTYIYPNVDEKTRTAKVRMEFHNPGYFLKPGMFATVKVTSELEPSALLVPNMAILRSGEKNTVFVALEAGKFEPRTVALGPQAENDMYEVLSGLKENERIVTSGQFLLDSESQLREAVQKMLSPQKSESHETTNVETQAAQGSTAATADARVKYICPMPEHVSIEYDHPGKCPICGMALVPVSQLTLRKLQPGGKLLYYTCPMPEHSDVHASKPGNCPKCGMTLIPVMEAPPLPKTSSTNAVNKMEMPAHQH